LGEILEESAHVSLGFGLLGLAAGFFHGATTVAFNLSVLFAIEAAPCFNALPRL
jgi:hypothetical protein